MTGETRLGAAAEFARIPAQNLISIPDGVSYVDAASLPIAYGTAYRMMTTRGHVSEVRPFWFLALRVVLEHAVCNWRSRLGARCIVTGSAEWKLDALRALGAEHTINTSDGDFAKAVHEIVGKPPYGRRRRR